MTSSIDITDETILLQQMVDTIVREASPKTIILFGSRTQGVRGWIPMLIY